MSDDNELWSELALLRALLKALHDRERSSETATGRGAAVLDKLMGRFQRLEERAFERALPSKENRRGSFGEGRAYLYLEAVEKGARALPVLDVQWDFDKRPPRVALRLMLFLWDNGSLRSIGVRLESADHAGEMHNYPHAQLLSRLENPGHREHGEPTPQQEQDESYIPWLPETQPALPLPTSTLVGLLLCLILSLYGPPRLREIRRALPKDQRMVDLLRREYSKILPDIQLG